MVGFVSDAAPSGHTSGTHKHTQEEEDENDNGDSEPTSAPVLGFRLPVDLGPERASLNARSKLTTWTTSIERVRNKSEKHVSNNKRD